jgi:hypothetical protein
MILTGSPDFRAVSLPAHAEASELDEYKLKAAFIYNFAKFVEWPPSCFSGAQSPIRLCVLGVDPFEGEIKSLEAKRIGERALVVRYAEKVEEIQECHIVFIGISEKDRIDSVLNALKGSPVLTISDIDGFANLGGMIGLINAQDKVRFEVNLGAARLAKIEVSSKLLKLANRVLENH